MPSRTIDYLPLDEIERATVNPKGHDKVGISASVERFGVVEILVVDERTGRLVSGHGRLDALLAAHAEGTPPPDGVEVDEAGRWLAPVVRGWASADDDEASAALVAVNRLVEKGGWADPDELIGILAGLRDRERLDVAVGYDNDDLDALIASLAESAPAPVPEARRPAVDPGPDPVPATPITVTGDVWVLGAHRVVCGDSTDSTAYGLLLGDELADIVWTDPPYGVDYVGKTKDALTIEGDRPEQTRALVRDALVAATVHVRPGSPWYLAAPPGPLGTLFRLGIEDSGWSLHQVLVWVKDVFVLGHSDYHYRHEDVLYGWVPGPGRSGRGNHAGTRWEGTHSASTVFEVPRPKRSEEHPTMKPPALIEAHLGNSSKTGALVMDLFGGSGSTLVAAHRTGRTARLIEKTPGYVDVICRRYQRMTGDLPARPDGSTVDFLASGT